ncbi:hypothetical protein [Streptomyces sp. NPDC001401]|uniref:hypothetical protein n=1 Tax=Streptomyces sp. NPDC001401 TaxID=3364570 RepID=UPI00368A6725
MGTVLTVVAGIGSLAFTGVATYYGALASQDQLEQSREDSEREARSQAMQVSFWFEGAGTARPVLHVMNRSPDPVNGAVVRFQLRIFAKEESQHDTMASVAIRFDALPPCSLQTIETGQLRIRTHSQNEPSKLPSRPMYVTEPFLAFGDRDGRIWARFNGRLVTARETDKYKPPYHGVEVTLTGAPEETPAPDCGDDSGK